MKIVADSNVLLSAIISEGPPFDVVSLVFAGRVDLVFCGETFGELAEVLMTRSPFADLSRELRGAFLAHLSERGVWRRPLPQEVKCKDSDDQVFLDLAVSSGADYLVTGDKDLLEIGEVSGTKVCTAADFLRALGVARRIS